MTPYVLVVDDRALRREWTQRALSDGRYRIVAVPSAQRGLRYLRQVQFDAVVVGAHLRGMGADQFKQKVRQICPETPVVVVTFTWPVGIDVRSLSPGAYHSLVLCSQDREAAVRTMVEEALARSVERAKEA